MEVSSLADRFANLESSVEAISEQLKSDNAGRRRVAELAREEGNQSQPPPLGDMDVAIGSFRDLITEFKNIRDSLVKVKLPPDLVVGDSRAVVNKSD